MNPAVEVADAVAAHLNAGQYRALVTAQRGYRPVLELSDAELHVSVVPRGVELTPADRSRYFFDVTVDIGVQRKLPDALDEPALDELMELVAELLQRLRGPRLDTLPAAALLRLENQPVFAPEHLEQLHQFTSVLSATYRLAR